MITKRTGNGQTECTRCKEKGKFALNWDSFLYTFNNKPYCFECLMEMLEEKDKEIGIMKKYFQMIIDLGYDYDGFNNVKDLKGLIDALCKYASLGKECNTTEPIYVNGNKKYNILDEELKEGK